MPREKKNPPFVKKFKIIGADLKEKTIPLYLPRYFFEKGEGVLGSTRHIGETEKKIEIKQKHGYPSRFRAYPMITQQ